MSRNIQYNFANIKFDVLYCASCGYRSQYNRLFRHLKEKYESQTNQVEISSKTADSFDGSFEVFITVDNSEKVQIWSALKGEGNLSERNMAKFDEKISKILPKSD